ncbi:MAG: recombinase [Clostridia bacterium]|nr:recombinase [Clostridia bacterium]
MAIQNSLVKKDQTFSAFLAQDAMKRKINEIVGGEKGQQFITAIISAVSTNPGLAECEHSSIVSAALLGQSLNLTPSPQLGQYYLVPFNDKKRGCKVAQFQLGYKGYIQLAIRSGYYKKINVIALKEGELIKYDPLAEEIEVNLIEDDEVREETNTIGYYAMFEYKNGFRKTLYWSKKKMLTHANKYSQAFNLEAYKNLQDGKIPQSDLWKYSSFWYKDFDGMAYKTMLRQLISKWGIMSIEMQEAYTKDMATIKENGEYEYVDNVETSYEEETSISANEPNNTEVLPKEEKEDKTIKKGKEENNTTNNTDDDFFNN